MPLATPYFLSLQDWTAAWQCHHVQAGMGHPRPGGGKARMRPQDGSADIPVRRKLEETGGQECPRSGQGQRRFRAGRGGFFGVVAGVLGCLAADSSGRAELGLHTAAQAAYEQSAARYKQAPRQAEAAWQFARACFDRAEFATNRTERADLAEQGIAAARQVLEGDARSAPAHYYLGMNLGQLARTRGLSALRIVDEMEREFSLARGLDPNLDNAGPDRNLGMLYRDAPAIGSVGSRSKARQHMLRAVALAPLYPENRLNLLETFLKWSDRNGARGELNSLEEAWPAARARFTGPAWEASWTDWTARLQQARKKLVLAAKTLESPREKR